MKNLFKRIITTILVLTMVMGFNVPFSATTVMAASITYNVSSTIKGVLTDDGVLTISGTGAMPDYTKIANIPWYKDRDRISEVRFSALYPMPSLIVVTLLGITILFTELL